MQGEVEKLAKSAVEYPPMQAATSFNLDAVKKKLAESAAGHGQYVDLHWNLTQILH